MTSSLDPTLTASTFLGGARGAGAVRAVLSPGSRSTPLSVAAYRRSDLSVAIHLDERSAAFAALGEAKVAGRPVILICTSGTAAANYLPAVAEARQAGVPLVVVTADRPPEHQNWGVGQSFPQRGLYGAHCVDEIEMPVGTDGGYDHAWRAGLRATTVATEMGGPVHVNWPFRMPLEPSGALAEYDPPSDPTVAERVRPAPNMRDVGHLNELAQVAEGVIIAGPSTVRPGPQASSDREAVWNFARRTGWPILADVLSGIRGSAPGVTVVDCPDLLARSGHLPEARVILRVGDTPTAKSLRQWWEGSSAEHVLVDPDGRWHDPSHRVTVRIRAGLALLLDQCSGTPDPSWAARWATAGHSAREAVDAALQSETWTEAQVASSLAGHESIKSIVASSSMPVRDLDTFAQASNPVPVLSNRGINGIDGVISTAIGVTRGTEQRQTVYIGDVAVLHDIGGLLDAVRQGIDMTVVVPNNNGGGIFSHLPIRGVLEDSEYVPLFHTPHDTDFSFLGHIEGLTFEQATRESFDSILRSAESRSGISVIECPVETDTSVAHLQRLANAVSTALE